jgi:PAS domain S-box-containing protein
VQRERIPAKQLVPLLAEGRRSFQIEHLDRHPLGRSDLACQEGLASQLSLALVASGQFMGVLSVYNRDVPRSFSPDEVKLAETFAQQAAITLANAMLLQRTAEERGKLSAVLSSTTDAVLAVDNEGDLILANPSAEKTFGLSAESAMGQPLIGEVTPELAQLFERVRQRGEPVAVEVPMQGERTLYASVSPVAGVGQVAVVQDITLLKELEEMRLREEQEERHRLRRIFEQYVSPELMDRILAQETTAMEQRELRDAVILFTDLRGFTRMTSISPFYEVIEVLNEFFTAMVDVVQAYQGTVFDLAGDELMVSFGAPFAQKDASEKALHAAGKMQLAFGSLRGRWRKERNIDVGLGVGIDRGTVAMGSIGAPSRVNFGLVGDAVNTAHHLVERAQHGEIIVSEAFVASLNGEFEGWTFQHLPPVTLKGTGEPVQIYKAVQT